MRHGRLTSRSLATLLLSALGLAHAALPAFGAFTPGRTDGADRLRDAACDVTVNAASQPMGSRLVDLKAGAAIVGERVDLVDERAVIPIDDTGVASWALLNPRSPYLLVHRKPKLKVSERGTPQASWLDACSDLALAFKEVEFQNRTADRFFTIDLPFEFRVPARPSTPDEAESRCSDDSCRANLLACRTALAAPSFSPKTVTPPECGRFLDNFRNKLLSDGLAYPNDEARQRLLESIRDWHAVMLAGGPLTCTKKEESPPEGPYQCTYHLELPPTPQPVRVPPELLAALPVDRVTRFTVRLSTEAPDVLIANNTGYLARRTSPKEDETRINFSMVSVGVGYSHDPEPADNPNTKDKVETYSADNPFTGDRRSRFTGAGRVSLAANLGSRAQGNAILQFLAGEVGAVPANNTLKAPQYSFSIFGDIGAVLRLGRTDFATPGKSIAIAESGEGIELAFRQATLTHLVKRESQAGVANDDDLDSEVTLLQVRSIPLRNAGILRSLNLFAERGEEERRRDFSNKEDLGPEPHRFTSYGTEIDLAHPPSRMAGTLALFHSSFDATNSRNKFQKGEGEVGLLTLGWSRVAISRETGKNETQASLVLTLGYGSGDETKTTNRDEGFLGETASYVGGTFFLGSLSSEIGQSRRGLSNKRLLSTAVLSNQISLLEFVPRLLGSVDPIGKRYALLRVSQFRFNQAVEARRDAGLDFVLETGLEVPKGVTYTLTFGWFQPGEALKPILTEDTWKAELGVRIDIR